MAFEAVLDEIGHPAVVGDRFTNAGEPSRVNSDLDPRISNDIAKPISLISASRGHIDRPVDLFVLQRSHPRQSRFPSPGSQEQDDPSIQTPQANGVEELRRQLDDPQELLGETRHPIPFRLFTKLPLCYRPPTATRLPARSLERVHREPPRVGVSPRLQTPRRALLTVWVVVNLVNLLQATGFATRVFDPNINRVLGAGIIALGMPAGLALLSFIRSNSGWRLSAGPVCFVAFTITSFIVDYLLEIEFRTPRRPEILVPYLMLFFGSIVLMGTPMFRIDRRLWGVTVATTLILVGAMAYALIEGVG